MSIDILIVEDSRLQAELLRGRLEAAGYQVRIAGDGRLALEQIGQRKPDLVVSDINMPAMDGYELCRTIKQDVALRGIPVILLSGLDDPEDIIRGLDAGADNYITKSCTPDYLLTRVEDLLHTPIEFDEAPNEPLEVTLTGKTYTVDAGRRQVLNLLVSTFENAVEKNRELLRVNSQLTTARDELQRHSRELQHLNQRLQTTNERMARDLEAGAALQRSLLPRSLPENDRFRFAWSFRPCSELAGDLLNVFSLDPHHLAVYIVDVSGHGVAAALLSVAISRMLSPLPHATSLLVDDQDGRGLQIVPPVRVMSQLNRLFPMEQNGGFYFAVLYGVLDSRRRQFRYVSAGQPRIMRMRADGTSDFLAADGFPVGWFDDADYQETAVDLQAGDRLYFYSDGIPEAFSSAGQPFGKQGLVRSLQKAHSQPLQQTVQRLTDDVERWCGDAGPDDDVSILAVEVVDG